MNEWETVIGLEVHARLLTRTKLFCSCAIVFGAPPNSLVCPVCLGYPGALPVLNGAAVDLALRMAAATDCTIDAASVFARKNYFYPDLPKGYQITQYDRPIATHGRLPVGPRSVRIARIHIEEDAGKLLHENASEGSLVDFNRAGTPLIEIVSEPEIGSAEEATAYLTRLRQVLMYAGVCDGNMEEGSLRCDGNISVRRRGEPLGTRVEVKNLNSFRFLARAITHEVERQIDVISRGERVVQETRLFDVPSGETRPMRSKEEAHDYRYFPEPDLLPLRLSDAQIAAAREALPPLPFELEERWQREHSISAVDAAALAATLPLAKLFEETARLSGNPKAAANWVRNDVLRLVNDRGLSVEQLLLTPEKLSALIRLIDSGEISGRTAKEIFEEVAQSGLDPADVVRDKGLAQVTDESEIRRLAESVIAAHPDQLAKYRSGKSTLFGFFVGQVLKTSGGKARPEIVNRIVRELLDAN